MRFMLHTSTVAALMRGQPRIDARLLELDPAHWGISAITHAEICYGLSVRPKAARLALAVREFLAVTTTAPWDAAAAASHGALRARLRAGGIPLGDFDEMIAGHAMALGAVLVTDQLQHFEAVPGLQLEDWLS